VPVGRDGWFEAAAPIPVEGGVRVRTARGSIGAQWWSRRFVHLLEETCDGGRLARGRAYARKGQVIEYAVTAGLVTALVQGSRPQPYRVRIAIPAYAPATWDLICAELAGRALYRAALLAGEMPPEIEEVFAALGWPLFPAALDLHCTCPDHGVPCKHLSAVLYVLAEAFDDDPFLVLRWRGRGREELLAALRGTAVDPPAPADPPTVPDVPDVPFADRMADFYGPAVSLARLRDGAAGPPTPPELLLRALEPPPVTVRHRPLLDLLRPAYRALPDGDPPGSPHASAT